MALASPIRGEIFEAVIAAGEASIAEIAALLDRPAASLYYHFEKLTQVGLLIAAGERLANTQMETLFRPSAIRYRFDKENRSEEYREAMRRLVKASLSKAQRQFDLIQSSTGEDPTQLLRVSAKIDLSTAEEFKKRLSDLGEWLRSMESTEGERYTITAIFAPSQCPGPA